MKSTIAKNSPRIVVRESKRDGIQNYDIDNSYPQRIRNHIKSSGRTMQCISIYAKFLRGSGFSDPFYKTVVNRKGLTVDKIHRKAIFDSYAPFKGFAFHINYNMLGEKTSIDTVPFEELRLGIPDDNGIVSKILHHPDWAGESSKRFDDKKITEYDIYNPDPQVIIKQATDAGGFAKWKGQIFWFSSNGPFKYPEASCDPVLEDVVADHEAKKFRLNNITTNFMASHVMSVPAFATGDDKDGTGAAEKEGFVKNLKDFQGADNTSRIFLVERDGPENDVKLEKIEIQDMDGLFKQTEDSTLDSIRRNYMIPAVLLSDLIAGKLGTAQEIQDAFAWMNSSTADERMLFEEVFTELFRNWHQPNVNPNADYKIGELRFGEERILVEKLGVGGTQALQAILIDPTLKPTQKTQILIQVFGITEENANKLMA